MVGILEVNEVKKYETGLINIRAVNFIDLEHTTQWLTQTLKMLDNLVMSFKRLAVAL